MKPPSRWLRAVSTNTASIVAIEGEQLNLESLRSSVAHRLHLANAPGPDRSMEGMVQVMQDALANHSTALDLDRLCRWQSALFPGARRASRALPGGHVRDHADAMQIVSGPLGRQVVHYEAPPSAQVAVHMDKFLAWFEGTRPTGEAAAINGIAPEAVAIDATSWVQWFVQAFTRACVASQAVVTDATEKTHFRLRAAQCQTNQRQSKVLERLLEAGHVRSGGGFLGGHDQREVRQDHRHLQSHRHA